MRPLIIAALVSLVQFARAGTFEYSYDFDSGQFFDKDGLLQHGPVNVHGTFNGTRVGNFVENPTDITMIINRMRFESFFAISWERQVGALSPTSDPVHVSFDALENNFIFYENTDLPHNHTYFYMLADWQTRTLVDSYGPGMPSLYAEAAEFPAVPAHWHLQEVIRGHTVPEGGATASMLVAAAAILVAAHRRTS